MILCKSLFCKFCRVGSCMYVSTVHYEKKALKYVLKKYITYVYMLHTYLYLESRQVGKRGARDFMKDAQSRGSLSGWWVSLSSPASRLFYYCHFFSPLFVNNVSVQRKKVKLLKAFGNELLKMVHTRKNILFFVFVYFRYFKHHFWLNFLVDATHLLIYKI